MILQNSTPEGYVSVGSYVGIYYEGIVLGILTILIINLFFMYRRTKVKMTYNLFLGYLCYTATMLFSWLAKWYLWQHSEAALEGPYLLQLIYKFKISMVFVILGNYFLRYFFGIIYSKNLVPPERSTKLIIIRIVEISFILLSHIPAYLTGDPELALITDAICFFIMIIDMTIFIPYGKTAFKNTKEKAFGKIYIYIGLMCFFMFNTAVMLFLDRATMVLEIPGPFGELGYTIFYFLGWTSVIVAMIFAMFGFVRNKQV